MNFRLQGICRLLVVATLGACPLAAPGSSPTAQTSSPDAAQPVSFPRVRLEYQEITNRIYQCRLPLRARSEPFAREPAWTNQQVLRAYLEIGRSTNDHLPMAWDFAQGRLYLDLNRNEDLTDDARGCFLYHGFPNKNAQIFTNLHLACRTEQSAFGSCFDLHLRRYGHVRAYATMRSVWLGKIYLGNQEWQAGWIESLTTNLDEPRYLLLRPWSARTEPFRAENGSLDAFRFSRRLFWGGQGYDLLCASELDAATPIRTLEFRPWQPELGELKIVGSMIERLVLWGASRSVVLDAPPPVIKIPAASYAYARVTLRQGQAQAYGALPQTWVWRENRTFTNWMTISAERSAVLAIGGPLTNAVTFSRSRQFLELNYQLWGAGGAGYHLLRRGEAPRWTAYQGGRRIASGTFEFG